MEKNYTFKINMCRHMHAYFLRSVELIDPQIETGKLPTALGP